MPKPKKRPSKNAKAAQKAVKESELLATKTAREVNEQREFNTSVVTPRTSTAIKPRPDKKRG
jgi:hypothetical protein